MAKLTIACEPMQAEKIEVRAVTTIQQMERNGYLTYARIATVVHAVDEVNAACRRVAMAEHKAEEVFAKMQAGDDILR